MERILDLLLATDKRDEIRRLQEALVASARMISDVERRADPILQRYETVPDPRKPDLLRPLAEIGGRAALELVIRERHSEDSGIQTAAVYALSHWPHIDAADELLSLCRETSEPKVLYTALQGYVRLVGEADLATGQKTAMLEEAMDLPLGTQEKTLVLDALSRLASLEAVKLASRYLDDEEAGPRSARTVLRIALPEAGREGVNEGGVIPFLKRARDLIEDEQERLRIDSFITGVMEREGFVPLFNGTDLTGWMGDTTGYAVEDGRIVIHPDRGSGNLYTEQQYQDFVLRFEFRLTPGANNGLGIRTPPEGDAAYVGMELQILDNTAPVYRDLRPYQYHGSIYGVVPAKRGHLRPVGEWNYQEVTADGRRIFVVLNGQVIVDADIDRASAGGTMDGRDHPGLKRTRGHIGFLGHGSRVEFRNIWIKELDRRGPDR